MRTIPAYRSCLAAGMGFSLEASGGFTRPGIEPAAFQPSNPRFQSRSSGFRFPCSASRNSSLSDIGPCFLPARARCHSDPETQSWSSIAPTPGVSGEQAHRSMTELLRQGEAARTETLDGREKGVECEVV